MKHNHSVEQTISPSAAEARQRWAPKSMSLLRDEFSEKTKRLLADRVSNRCSNPSCRATTSGPRLDPTKALNVGVAAHITAAAPGGARYDPMLTADDRSAAENGIWLCQNCAKLVDNDASRFNAELLRKWRAEAESAALAQVGKISAIPKSVSIVDKWVSTAYLERIIQKLQSEGFECRTATALEESECIDFEGWQLALVEEKDGFHARLKLRDVSAIGDYHVLLKRLRAGLS